MNTQNENESKQEPLSEDELKVFNKILEGLTLLTITSFEDARRKGFWDEKRNDGEMIALMHSELSELLEVLRKDPEKESEKLSAYLAAEEELADLIIRACDFAGGRGYSLSGAVISKLLYNRQRPYKHGKKF